MANYELLIEHAVNDLCNAADRRFGRRLALVLGDAGWRIGYQVPHKRDPATPWAPDELPACWMVQDWLGGDRGDPELFASPGDNNAWALCDAWASASTLHDIILARVSARARAGAGWGELLIVAEPEQIEPDPADALS